MLKDMHLDMPVVCQQRRDMKIAASCWGGGWIWDPEQCKFWDFSRHSLTYESTPVQQSYIPISYFRPYLQSTAYDV